MILPQLIYTSFSADQVSRGTQTLDYCRDKCSVKFSPNFREHLNDMEKETGRLLVIIREADADKKRQQKELDQVITERDILGTQLGKSMQ